MSTNPISITLFHHKEREWADYLVRYSSLRDLRDKGLATISVESLPQQNAHIAFARLPERLRKLLFFAKPDLVVTLDDGQKPVMPVFAIDATEHVAARDHWIQRFPNLVGCAQEGVPGAFVAPRDMPHRARFQGKADPFFFFAYDRVVEIHQTPIYIAEWPSANGKDLDSDAHFPGLPPSHSASISAMLAFFDLTLDAAIKGRDLSTLMHERLILDLRNELRNIGFQRIPRIADFERLSVNMPNGECLSSAEVTDWLTERALVLPSDLPDRIKKRSRNIIFSPQVGAGSKEHLRASLKERIKLRGGDPYTQQPLVFDYLFCRLGKSPLERDTNLIIDLSILEFSDFAEYVVSAWEKSPLRSGKYQDIKRQIPTYTLHLKEGINQELKNFVRLYSFAADMIVFEDGILYF